MEDRRYEIRAMGSYHSPSSLGEYRCKIDMLRQAEEYIRSIRVKERSSAKEYECMIDEILSRIETIENAIAEIQTSRQQDVRTLTIQQVENELYSIEVEKMIS